MSFNEKQERLKAIIEIVNTALEEVSLSYRPMLVSTQDLLLSIREAAGGEKKKSINIPAAKKEKIVISCDGSINGNTNTPDRKAAVAALVECPGKPDMPIVRASRAKTINQVEYEAVYNALVSFFGLVNRPKFDIEMRSDSQIVVGQLNKEMKCNDETLQNKRDAILELVEGLPVRVSFIWRPRCSTRALEWADEAAKDMVRKMEEEKK